MKFSERWLREWVNPSVDTGELAHILTMAGLEVDAIEPVAGEFDQTVVGLVCTVKKHQDAEKLNVCSVDVGAADKLQIVCGAPNVREGMKAPVAMVGATLPGGMKIKKAKLRGVESFGMLCSAKELGMAEAADGLMELVADAPVGRDIRDYFWLDDQMIELGLTPNRGDCLSIAGIARELGTLCKAEVTIDEFSAAEPTTESQLGVSIDAPEDCPRYLCQVIEGINPDAATPMWIREALRRSGVRSLGPVVDVTNFVMLELGQPMHAFDLDNLSGGICVRHAQQDEPLSLLDGSEVILKAGTLVIADHEKALALAGIMGGEDSAVSNSTQAILLESAFFSPLGIAGKARSYGLHTDSSHRFERGVDPEIQRRAIDRATSLLLEIVGGNAGPVVEAVSGAHLPQRAVIQLRPERITRILGQDIPAKIVTDILTRLGLAVESQGHGWQVQAPGFRFDIEIEEDLIEEIARVYGYEQLPTTLPDSAVGMQPDPEGRVGLSRVRGILIERGYQEAITYSFVDPKLQELLNPGEEGIALANPISADMAVMRTSHWPGLAQAAMHNINRQQNSIKFFESGLKFLGQSADIKQEEYLSGIVSGALLPEQWGQKERPVDFFDVKNDLEALLETLAYEEFFSFRAGQHPALHPGQTAEIVDAAGQRVGWLGALHPQVESKLGIGQQVFVYEIALKCFEHAEIPRYQAASKYPSVRRDVAVVLDKNVSIEAIKNVVKKASTGMLNKFQLFDVYQGKGIDSGRKSVAFGLTFQDHTRTLEDADVEEAMGPIISALQDQFGATLRE